MQQKKKLTHELKALFATDLGKIFAVILVFLTSFLIIPLIFPILRSLQAFIIEFITAPTAPTDQVLYLIVALVGIIFLIAFFGFGMSLLLIRLGLWITNKIAPKPRRSNLQQNTRYVAIIVGVLLGVFLIGYIYDTFTIGVRHELIDLVPAFTQTLLMTAIFVTVLFGAVYICIFINDIAFFIYRGVTNKPLIYTPPEERLIVKRNKVGLSVVAFVMILCIIGSAFIIYLTKPATVRVNQRAEDILTIGVDSDEIVIRAFEVYSGSITPAEFQSIVESPPTISENVVGAVINKIPGPMWIDHNVATYSFDYMFSIPRGLNVIGIKLTVDIDTGVDTYSGSSFFYPDSNYECSFLTKFLYLTQITVSYDTFGITGFTFVINLEDTFQFTDLLNFGW